jgi:hypothetical protein
MRLFIKMLSWIDRFNSAILETAMGLGLGAMLFYLIYQLNERL